MSNLNCCKVERYRAKLRRRRLLVWRIICNSSNLSIHQALCQRIETLARNAHICARSSVVATGATVMNWQAPLRTETAKQKSCLWVLSQRRVTKTIICRPNHPSRQKYPLSFTSHWTSTEFRLELSHHYKNLISSHSTWEFKFIKQRSPVLVIRASKRGPPQWTRDILSNWANNLVNSADRIIWAQRRRSEPLYRN